MSVRIGLGTSFPHNRPFRIYNPTKIIYRDVAGQYSCLDDLDTLADALLPNCVIRGDIRSGFWLQNYPRPNHPEKAADVLLL
jgi:hypothetical protein